MMETGSMKWIYNPKARKDFSKKVSTCTFNNEEIKKVRKFHMSFPQYEVTPLRSLDNLAESMGISKIWVKDESYRFGLNAFKVLGGSYSIGKYISQKLDMDIKDLSFKKIRSKEIKEKLGQVTFVTATDGNHGRGVAWVANQLSQKSVVYMPKGSAKQRYDNIKKEGSDVTITDLNYDDAVRLAMTNAEKYGWVVIQDTAWDGYEDIPTWIMQGYTTIGDEIVEQLKNEKPTHIFLQAGVGSFAGSIEGYFTDLYKEDRPITVVVEPDNAACIFKSADINDGKPHAVTGDLSTIMAGLSCGEPNPIGWKILRDYADMYVSCPDFVSARGMRILGNPLGTDEKVISGESGAVGLGLASLLTQSEELKEIKEKLNINKDSKILVISTEGDTDPVNYRKVVWDGAYTSI